jgi:hypothetical protein
MIAATEALATPPAYDTELFDTVHGLLFDAATNAPSIANITRLAHRHSQSVFAHALSRHRLALRLARRAADHAVARVRACTLRGAAALLLCHRIPPGTLLSDAEFTFFVCHRLSIPIPLALVAAAAILRCTPKCRTITAAKPLTAAHALFPLHQHCLHQLTCGASSLRLRRHNNLARCAATTLAAEASLEASLTTNLHSSLTSNTRVDLLLTSALAEQDTAIDFTVSCPLLPTYLPTAVRDPTDIIQRRAAEKTSKHGPGSAARDRLFLPWVLTTFGGMGPKSIWHYVDTIYATSASLARASKAERHVVASRKADFLAALQAILTRSCFHMMTTHTAEHPRRRAAPAAEPTAPATPAAHGPAEPDTPATPATRPAHADPRHPLPAAADAISPAGSPATSDESDADPA